MVDAEASFAALIATSHRRDLAVARRFVGNEEDAADVVQESYLRAWRSLPTFRREAHLSTWLHAIIANTARTWRRRRTHHAPLADDVDPADHHPAVDPAWHVDVALDRAGLDEAIAQLAPALQSVVILKDVQGLSHRVIADTLGISETAAKVRLHRARRQLRMLLTAAAAAAQESAA